MHEATGAARSASYRFHRASADARAAVRGPTAGLEPARSFGPGRDVQSCVQGKVRSGPKAVLSEATVEALERRWAELLGPVTGCATYEAFRAKTNAELGRPF